MSNWKIRLKRFRQATGILLLLLVGNYGFLLLQRPPRTNAERPLFQGVYYQRQVLSQPRSLMVHIVSLDLRACINWTKNFHRKQPTV